jgi:SAM-dependent methyltransferase
MMAMPIAPASMDVVWAEGAIYIIGFEQGLRAWRALLRPSGFVAATHLSWLTEHPPAAPRRFWARHFPPMATVEDNTRIAERCGYELVDRFVLPESAWWVDYYGPLERRLAALREGHARDAAAMHSIDETQEQIDLYREFSAHYGYVFYVLRMNYSPRPS